MIESFENIMYNTHNSLLGDWHSPADTFREKLEYNDDRTFSGKYVLEQNTYPGFAESLVANVNGPFQVRESICSDKSLYQIKLDFTFTTRDTTKSMDLSMLKDLSNVLVYPKSEGSIDDHLNALRSITPILKGLAETLSKAKDDEALEGDSLINFSLSTKPAISIDTGEPTPSSGNACIHPMNPELLERIKTTKSNSNKSKIMYGNNPLRCSNDSLAEALKPIIFKVIKQAQEIIKNSPKISPQETIGYSPDPVRHVNVRESQKKPEKFNKIQRKITGWESNFYPLENFTAFPTLQTGVEEEVVEVSSNKESVANYLTVTGAHCLDKSEGTTEKNKIGVQQSSMSLSNWFEKPNFLENKANDFGRLERTCSLVNSDNITVATGDEFSWDSVSPKQFIEKIKNTDKKNSPSKISEVKIYSSSQVVTTEKSKPEISTSVFQEECEDNIKQQNDKMETKKLPTLTVDLIGTDISELRELLEQVVGSARIISEKLGSDLKLNILANLSLQSKTRNDEAGNEDMLAGTNDKEDNKKIIPQACENYQLDCCKYCRCASDQCYNGQLVRDKECRFEPNAHALRGHSTIMDRIRDNDKNMTEMQECKSKIASTVKIDVQDNKKKAPSTYCDNVDKFSKRLDEPPKSGQTKEFLHHSIPKLNEHEKNAYFSEKKYQDRSSNTCIDEEDIIFSKKPSINKAERDKENVHEETGRQQDSKCFGLDDQNLFQYSSLELLENEYLANLDNGKRSQNDERKKEANIYRQTNMGVHSAVQDSSVSSVDEVRKNLGGIKSQTEFGQSTCFDYTSIASKEALSHTGNQSTQEVKTYVPQSYSPFSVQEYVQLPEDYERLQLEKEIKCLGATGKTLTTTSNVSDTNYGKQSLYHKPVSQNLCPYDEGWYSKTCTGSGVSIPKKLYYTNSTKLNPKQTPKCSEHKPEILFCGQCKQFNEPNHSACCCQFCEDKRTCLYLPNGSIKPNTPSETANHSKQYTAERELPTNQKYQQDYNQRINMLINACRKHEKNWYSSPHSESTTCSEGESALPHYSSTEHCPNMLYTTEAEQNVKYGNPPIKTQCQGVIDSSTQRNACSSWSSITLLSTNGRGSCQSSAIQRSAEREKNFQKHKEGRGEITAIAKEFFERANQRDKVCASITSKHPSQLQPYKFNGTETSPKQKWRQ